MHKAAQRYDKLQSNWDLEIFTVKKTIKTFLQFIGHIWVEKNELKLICLMKNEENPKQRNVIRIVSLFLNAM